MIPVIQSGRADEDLRRVIHSINFSEDVLAFPMIPVAQGFSTDMPTTAFGGVNLWIGCSVDRSIFRERLKDSRWAVYAAGIVDTVDANAAVLGLVYVTDAGVIVPLGGIGILAGPGFAKAQMGPFDVFGTAGVPPNEVIPMLGMTAQKTAGGNGALLGWTLWIRFLPPTQ